MFVTKKHLTPPHRAAGRWDRHCAAFVGRDDSGAAPRWRRRRRTPRLTWDSFTSPMARYRPSGRLPVKAKSASFGTS